MIASMLDVITVGAGPAGLAAALALGRMRRRVAVVDSGEPRNHYTAHAHNYLTRDGLSPSELRRLGREEVERYPTVEFRDDRVTALRAAEDRVEVVLATGGSLVARRVVLAVGIKDVLPDIRGLAQIFGTSAFTCPYCDGYECADRAIGMICTAPGQLINAGGLMRMLTANASIFANAMPLSEEERDAAHNFGVHVVEPAVERLESERGMLRAVCTQDGVRHDCERLFVPWDVQPSNALAEDAGCTMTDGGLIDADDMGRTSVARVYAAGDAIVPIQQVSLATASGARAAMAINRDAIVANEIV
jgi:thioredoxin reductase